MNTRRRRTYRAARRSRQYRQACRWLWIMSFVVAAWYVLLLTHYGAQHLGLAP